MNDIDLQNEVRAESLREEFYQFLSEGSWAACRETLTLLEGMKVNTWELRREMNKAMGEGADDFDGAEKEMSDERERENDHDSHVSSYAD